MAYDCKLSEIEKKIKGYGFDSLIFRYKLAREAEARLQYRIDRKNGAQPFKDEADYLNRANRDIVRFIQILDDLLGEHD
jgi:hypothetical protein